MVLFHEVGQEVQHSKITFAAAGPLEDLLICAGVSRHGGWGGQEGVQQHSVGQCSQAALQVQQVGVSSADAGMGIGQPPDERAGVGWALQGPLIQVQQSQITTVLSQRMKNGGGCSGGGSEEEENNKDDLRLHS